MSRSLIPRDARTREPWLLWLCLLLDLTHVKLMCTRHWSVLNWDNRRNKCQNHSYLCLFQCATIFLVHSNGSSGFQAFTLKGHRKSKGRLFKHLHMPNESKSSQHIMKGFTSSSSGTSGKDRNVHPYHSSRKCDSSAKRQHGYFMSYNWWSHLSSKYRTL